MEASASQGGKRQMDRAENSLLENRPVTRTKAVVVYESYTAKEIAYRSRPDEIKPLLNLKRAVVKGKFLWKGSQKLYVRGVTYGTFKPDENGYEYPPREVVE